jgi:DAK2 domain fusion protein YloV
MAGLVPASRVESPLVADNFLDESHATRWGYCTQFIIEGESLVLDRVRGDFGQVAESVVVVGDERYIRVHLHAQDPGPALSYGTSLGQLSQIKIENMSLQNQEWDAGHRSKQMKPQGTAVVATVAGEGLERLFCQSGCSAIIRGGQTMNPSIQDILRAAELSGGQEVILLPNNKNILVAAEQAARVNVDGRILHVVPTLSIPQGVAALLAFNPEESLEHNLKTMRSALAEVVTIEITRAVRDSSIGGLSVQAGQFIALVDGELVLAEATVEAALSSALAGVKLSGSEVVTLYWGSDTTQAQAESVAINLEKGNPGLQVDVIYGGQPHYPYIASVE